MKKSKGFPFLSRALRGIGFKISLLCGGAIALAQVVQMYTPLNNDYGYPPSLYEMWIGAEWASYANALLFLVLPLLATLPFAGNLAADRKSGYLSQLLIRQSRRTVFIRYYGTTFFMGALGAIFPFAINFLLNAMLYPALPPQASTFTFLPSLQGFMVHLFYTLPLVYHGIYLLLIGLFCGAIACVGLSLGFFTTNPLLVHLLSFAGYFWLYYITMQLGAYSYNPYVFLNPSQSMVFKMLIYAVYVLTMLAISGGLCVLKGIHHEQLE